MPYPFPPDVKQLVFERMAAGDYPSEDDLIRDALLALSHENDDLQAVQEAIADWRSGDEGVSLKEAFDTVRGREPS